MRSEDRIDEICGLLRKCWHKVPDLRLGQLIDNILKVSDPFYVEDTKLKEKLENFLKDSK